MRYPKGHRLRPALDPGQLGPAQVSETGEESPGGVMDDDDERPDTRTVLRRASVIAAVSGGLLLLAALVGHGVSGGT